MECAPLQKKKKESNNPIYLKMPLAIEKKGSVLLFVNSVLKGGKHTQCIYTICTVHLIQNWVKVCHRCHMGYVSCHQIKCIEISHWILEINLSMYNVNLLPQLSDYFQKSQCALFPPFPSKQYNLLQTTFF